MLKRNQYFYFIVSSLILFLTLRYFVQLCNCLEECSATECFVGNQPSSRQAFILFAPQTLDINRQKDKGLSQEIIINGIDNNVLQHRLLMLLGINLNHNEVISMKEIENWVSKLKLSGFFTEVKLNNLIFQNHQVIRINVSVNPIFRSVSMIEYSKKIIPYSYILFLFRNQIGYPINFNRIDSSLNLISKWYHVRGYKWIEIKVINTPCLSQDITLDIQEGMISKVEFVAYDLQGSFVQTQENIPFTLLLEVMNIKPLQILNINYLEQGILRLKAQKLLSQCHYEVFRDNDMSGELHIVLKLEMLNQRSTYIFNKNISISVHLLESIELLLKYSIYNILHNGDFNPFLTTTRCTDLLLRNQPNLISSNNILYSDIHQEDKYFRELVSQRFLHNNQRFNEWHFTQFLFIVADHLGFRHYMHNVFFQNGYFLLDGSFSGIRRSPYFNFKYELPLISYNSLKIKHLTFGIFKHFFNSRNYSQLIPLNQLDNSYFCYQESLGSQIGGRIGSSYNINNKFSCHREVIYTHIASRYVHAHNYIRWNQVNIILNDLQTDDIYSFLRQIWTYNIEQLIQYHFKIKYEKDNNEINGPNLQIESIHLIPQGSSQLFYQTKNKLDYSNKTIIKVGRSTSIKSHIINCMCEFVYLFGSKDYLPFSQESLEIGEDIVRGYSKEVFPFPLKFGKINLEYHVPLIDKNTIFCFIDYAKYITGCNISGRNNLRLSQFLYGKDNNFYDRLSYGIGIHIRIPIKQLPPLRLEYVYNLHNKQCLHLRVYK